MRNYIYSEEKFWRFEEPKHSTPGERKKKNQITSGEGALHLLFGEKQDFQICGLVPTLNAQ